MKSQVRRTDRPGEYEITEESKRTYFFPDTVRDLERVVTDCGSHFFDADSKRYFGSRVDYFLFPAPNKLALFFVTSEEDRPSSLGRGAWGGQRRYTVYVWSPLNPSSVGKPEGYTFGQFATLETARRHAKKLATLFVESKEAVTP